MIHLHLTKYWFNKIKSGEKKSEFRPIIYFYENLIHNEMKKINPSIKFYLGYPDKNDNDKTIIKYIDDISIVFFKDLPDNEKKFFSNQNYHGTFYKIDFINK